MNTFVIDVDLLPVLQWLKYNNHEPAVMSREVDTDNVAVEMQRLSFVSPICLLFWLAVMISVNLQVYLSTCFHRMIRLMIFDNGVILQIG